MTLDNLSVLKAVFESTADGILIVGNDGKVIESNNRFAEIWKIPRDLIETHDDEKLLNFILTQLISPEKFISKVKDLYSDPEAISNDTIEFLDGRFFERYSRPLKVGDKTEGRVWSFRDITDYKKNQEFFSAIANLSPDIVSLIDESGKLVFNSKAAERIHGYAHEELINKNTFDLIHPDDQKKVSDTMAKILSAPEEIQTVEYRYLNKNGSWAWMEASASNQIHNPWIRGLVTISREIGKRKKLENELNQTLKERDEFMSIASHELKTPISSILLQLQMLQRYRKRLPDLEGGKRFEDIDGLVEQVQSIQRLIDDLLSVSRIRTGKLSLELEKQDFTTLVKTVVDRFKGMFEEAHCPLSLEIEENIFVSCDKIRITQVLFNLMSNSVKYAPGTQIDIKLKEENNFAVFSIRDHGKGIPKDKKEFIFGLFDRAVSNNYVSGLGIGLYISRSIIEGHKGTIFLQSEPGKGAEFIFKLPMSSR